MLVAKIQTRLTLKRRTPPIHPHHFAIPVLRSYFTPFCRDMPCGLLTPPHEGRGTFAFLRILAALESPPCGDVLRDVFSAVPDEERMCLLLASLTAPVSTGINGPGPMGHGSLDFYCGYLRRPPRLLHST
jgi:hypothetical protein